MRVTNCVQYVCQFGVFPSRVQLLFDTREKSTILVHSASMHMHQAFHSEVIFIVAFVSPRRERTGECIIHSTSATHGGCGLTVLRLSPLELFVNMLMWAWLSIWRNMRRARCLLAYLPYSPFLLRGSRLAYSSLVIEESSSKVGLRWMRWSCTDYAEVEGPVRSIPRGSLHTSCTS
ncbi:hypothetical protein K474DRAFT_1164628 [Panus rudis PR-1116 ss-1]|nr:hypothetical protein K474DRAFT_1164628 [Panus rudis PR-1116 ss-1]